MRNDLPTLHLIDSGVTSIKKDEPSFSSLKLFGKSVFNVVILGGDRLINGLYDTVADELVIHRLTLNQCIHLRRVLADCRCLTRCYEFVVASLLESPELLNVVKRGRLSMNDARHLNMVLIRLLQKSYPGEVWAQAFETPGYKNEIISFNAFRRALCIAVAGVEIESGNPSEFESHV